MSSRSWFAALLLTAFALASRGADDPYGDPLPAGATTRLGTLRYRVGGNYAPVVTPDAKTIYARDGSGVRRYDITGADRGAAPQGTPNDPPIAFSADGTRAVSGSYTTVVVWDVASGKTLVTLKRSIHFFDQGQPLADLSADGKVVAVGAVKRDPKQAVDVVVWDVDKNKEIALISAPHNEQAFVALSPDGKTVATWGKHTAAAGKDNPETDPGRFVHFWETSTGKPLSKARTTGFNPSAAKFSPDGSLAAVAGGSTVELVDPKTGTSKHLLLGRTGVGRALAFSPDGTTLFAAGNNGLVQRWQTSDGTRLSTTEPPISDAHYCSLRVTGADRAVAWATRSGTVIVWEVPSGKLLGPQDGHFTAIQKLTVTPDSKFVLTSAHDGQALKWELATGKLLGSAPGHPARGRSYGSTWPPDFSPGGAKSLVYDFGGYGVYDNTGVQEFVIPVDRPNANRAAFTADGSKVVTTLASYDGKKEPAEVGLWDVATAKRVFAVQLPGHSTIDAALTPDGKHLVTASRKPAEKGPGEFFVIAYATTGGEKKGELREEGGFGFAHVATAADSASAAVVTPKGKLVRFDIASGKAEAIPCGIDYVSLAPVFSSDGKLLAVLGPSSFGRPASVVVLEWATGKTKHTFACPEGGATVAAFSPDGKYLITGTNMGTALVWDLAK